MHVFGEINKSSTVVEHNVVNYTHNLSTSSLGIQSIKLVSGSISSSHWDSLNVLFYTSGSPTYIGEHKFQHPGRNLSVNKPFSTQHLTKYHGYPSSSIIQIPSTYYGEKIKEGSFEFTDLNNTDNSSNNPIIKDDGFGNLYSTNAYHSQSTNNASSSDLATNFTLKFDASNTITTFEYNVTLLPQDYNHSMNYTLRSPLIGTGELKLSTQYLAKDFTSSLFHPYITTIDLYQDGVYDSPVIQAKLNKPIKKSKKINTTFKIRLDI